MKEFLVTGEGLCDEVSADGFEVEGGVLVFYKTPPGTTLASTEERLFLAYNKWSKVKQL